MIGTTGRTQTTCLRWSSKHAGSSGHRPKAPEARHSCHWLGLGPHHAWWPAASTHSKVVLDGTSRIPAGSSASAGIAKRQAPSATIRAGGIRYISPHMYEARRFSSPIRQNRVPLLRWALRRGFCVQKKKGHGIVAHLRPQVHNERPVPTCPAMSLYKADRAIGLRPLPDGYTVTRKIQPLVQYESSWAI